MPFTPGIDPRCGLFFRPAFAGPLSGDLFRSRFPWRAVAGKPPEVVYARFQRRLAEHLQEAKRLGSIQEAVQKPPVTVDPAPGIHPMEKKMQRKLKVLGLALLALSALVDSVMQRAVGTFGTNPETQLGFTEEGSKGRLLVAFQRRIQSTRDKFAQSSPQLLGMTVLATGSVNNPITGKALLRPVGSNNNTNQRETKSQKQLPGSAGIEQLQKCLA